MPYEVIVFRLLLIMLLSGLIGIEREYHGKPAGLRTNVVVGLAATLMTLSSIRGMELFADVNGFDPTRVVSTIVTGIGFIGAGAILRKSPGGGDGVIGLTTAATLWLVTGLGIAVGMGFYFEAIFVTALVFVTFIALSKIVDWTRRYAHIHPPKPIPEEDDHDDN
jgi:putative Mg2+ transporter-C (MgtC) family protein